MKIPKNNLLKQENDLKTIIHSLFCACALKYQCSCIDVSKKDLLFKIVDNCQVTPTKASEYLHILESRRNIIIDGDIVHFTTTEKQSELNNLEFQ